MCPAVRSTAVKHAGLNVSGSSRGSSSFDFSKESFDTPSRKYKKATAQKLAAERDRMHIEGPAKAGKLCKVRTNLQSETHLTRATDKA